MSLPARFLPIALLSLLACQPVFASTSPKAEPAVPKAAPDNKKHPAGKASTSKEGKKNTKKEVRPATKPPRPRQEKRKTTTVPVPDTSPVVTAQPYAPALASFMDDMTTKHGFDRSALDTLFGKVRHSSRAITLTTPQPVTVRRNWQEYRARFIEPTRIQAGIRFIHKYPKTLARAESEYGVPASVIAAIIGVETKYGQNTGNFRVVDVLTTLAFDYPAAPNRTNRMSLFRRELEEALLYAREAKLDPLSLKGSYAGAIGWPQFMPSSIRQYAVDYDGKGKIDLMNSVPDAIGSVGNFLVRHGWVSGRPVIFRATVSDANTQWQSMMDQGLKAKYSASETIAAGITTQEPLPTDLQYGLVYLENGDAPTEYWLVTDNFYAVTQYNRSYAYAMSVIQFADVLREATGLPPSH